jgi:hypothetical protein
MGKSYDYININKSRALDGIIYANVASLYKSFSVTIYPSLSLYNIHKDRVKVNSKL